MAYIYISLFIQVCEDFLDEILSQGGEELLGLGSEVKGSTFFLSL